MKIGRKVPPHNGKLPGAIPNYETSPQRWTEH